MRYLSKVVVQHAPFLRRVVPDLYVWKEPLFSAPSYVAFEAKALAEAEIAQTTMSQQIRQVMPELADFISTNFKAVFDVLRKIDAKGQDTNASLAVTTLEEPFWTLLKYFEICWGGIWTPDDRPLAMCSRFMGELWHGGANGSQLWPYPRWRLNTWPPPMQLDKPFGCRGDDATFIVAIDGNFSPFPSIACREK